MLINFQLFVKFAYTWGRILDFRKWNLTNDLNFAHEDMKYMHSAHPTDRIEVNYKSLLLVPVPIFHCIKKKKIYIYKDFFVKKNDSVILNFLMSNASYMEAN